MGPGKTPNSKDRGTEETGSNIGVDQTGQMSTEQDWAGQDIRQE